jgi:hypothetical protein
MERTLMAERREFSRPVKIAIYRRAKDPAGVLRCEKCCAAVVAGDIHHIVMDAMVVDKGASLTVDDGIFLCRPCHKDITKSQAPVLAKVKRIEAKHLGIRKAPTIQSRPFPKRERERLPLLTLPPRRPIYEED